MTAPNSEIIRIVRHLLELGNDESEIRDFIKEDPFFENYCGWNKVGGNVSTFWTQQEDVVNAIPEPIINAFESKLLERCYEMGLDPRDYDNPELPKTIHQNRDGNGKITANDIRLCMKNLSGQYRTIRMK